MQDMTESDVRELLKQAVRDAGSAAQFARRNGLSSAFISDVAHGHKPPGRKITDALGLKRVTTYRRVEAAG